MEADNNYIVLDVETGGLDETKYQITQLAFKVLDGFSFKEILKFETFIKPYASLLIDKEVLKKTTVKMTDVMNNGVDSKLLVKNLCQTFKNAKTKKKGDRALPVLVGHNVKFDIKFMKFLFKSEGQDLFEYISEDYFCTNRMSYLAWKNQLKSDDVQSLKLGVCCERAGIKLIDAHGAMADVNATTDLFKYFCNKISASGVEKEVEEEISNKTRKFYQF
jgi:DNA polymerase III alpha subunit (gram-positive type)